MNTQTNHTKIVKLTQAAFLAALIVVLQIVTYFIKVGQFNLSFVLVPIVVGGILLGPKYGAILGGVFGVVVTLVSAFGMDGAGFILFSANPVLCTLVCLLKGIAAGFVPAVVYKAMSNNVGLVIAAALAPICNTGIFCAGMLIFFRDTLNAWAGGTNVLTYIITGLVGINFIIEFCINIVLTPVIAGVVKSTRKAK